MAVLPVDHEDGLIYVTAGRDLDSPKWRVLRPVFAIIVLVVFFQLDVTGVTPKLLTGAEISQQESATVGEKDLEVKTILLWNKFRDVVGASNDHPIETLFSRCSVPHCRATFDRSELTTSSAVLFHMAEFRLNDLPLSRDASQHFVFTHFESVANRYLVPSHRHWLQLDEQSGGFFNLTMTYRTDSDVYFDAYTMYYRPHLIANWTDLMVQKKKGVLWLVSHCRTQGHREDYAGELSKYLKIDKFGKCSGRGVKNPCVYGRCTDEFRRSYKFQLAFENSVCQDYTTEKLYRALNDDVVPVVLGGGNYSTLLPPHSYINIEDFTSVKDLADHLIFLMNNEEEYKKYFAWKLEGKSLWQLPDVPDFDHSGWCQLCRRLHEDRPPKTIRDVSDWWFRDQCRKIDVVQHLFKQKHPKFK